MTLVYQNTFVGLLTAIYWDFHYNADLIISEKDHQPQLLEQVHVVTPDEELASKLAHRILSRFGQETFEKIYSAFLSESSQSAMAIKHFLAHARGQVNLIIEQNRRDISGTQIIRDYAHSSVYPLLNLARMVEREGHLMLGLIRFNKLKSGIYYAKYDSTYDVLQVLSAHFTQRLSDQSWVIHDLKRQRAAFYNLETCWISDLDGTEMIIEEQDDFRDYWKTYCQHISIEARRNLKRQQHFIPRKYWHHLPEINR